MAASIESSQWTDDYVWIVVIGAFATFFAAFGIGANDVANAFATSVGSGALTIKQAVVIAAVFEFAGALFLGSNVMETVRKDIADPTCFEDNPALLMQGMMCALFSVGFWLLLASYLKMPVSTTHSIVGAIVGMTLATQSSDCVTWYEKKDDWPYVGGVGGIVLSWIVAPLLAYGFALVLFLIVRTTVLRSQNPFQRAFWLYPILGWCTLFTLTLFIIFKGAKSKSIADEFGDTEEEQDGYSTLTAIIVATVVVVIVTPFGLPYLRNRINEEYAAKHGKGGAVSTVELGEADNKGKITDPAAITPAAIPAKPAADNADKAGDKEVNRGGEEMKGGDLISKAKGVMETMMQDVVTKDDRSKKIHANAEVFDEKTEMFFQYVQIFTVCCDAFAHGANDVANSVGPFAAIYVIYNTGVVSEDSELGDDAYWILGFGGIGIVLGLALYGYKIIQVLGTEMACVTPSRGFAIELGAVAVIIMGTRLGIPLSTTHCQVGATCGVAHAEGRGGVNYKTLLVVVSGWVLTLVVAGCTAALFTALGAYAPSKWGPAYDGMPNELETLYNVQDANETIID